jgi:hypothetical protein
LTRSLLQRRICLVTAIAALGMKISLKAMAEVGGRAIALIVAETVFPAIPRPGDCGLEILNGKSAAATAKQEVTLNEQRQQYQIHVDDRHQGDARLGLSAFHSGDDGGGHGP